VDGGVDACFTILPGVEQLPAASACGRSTNGDVCLASCDICLAACGSRGPRKLAARLSGDGLFRLTDPLLAVLRFELLPELTPLRMLVKRGPIGESDRKSVSIDFCMSEIFPHRAMSSWRVPAFFRAALSSVAVAGLTDRALPALDEVFGLGLRAWLLGVDNAGAGAGAPGVP